MVVTALRAAARSAYGRLIAKSRMDAYLAEHAEAPRLNIGSGYNTLPGWLNVDLDGGRNGPVHMNAARRFPFADDVFHAVLCEHMIEHISEAEGANLVREAFRVLRPGGRIRIITPDLENLAKLCLAEPDEKGRAYLAFVAKLHGRETISPGDALNYIFYEYGHRHIYTIAKLRAAMAKAGFADIIETRAGHPVDPVFHGAEGHPNFMGLDNDAVEAFALEAVKPVR